jgi:uncharacterized protein with von Willebrand factor type A (vWA) domain
MKSQKVCIFAATDRGAAQPDLCAPPCSHSEVGLKVGDHDALAGEVTGEACSPVRGLRGRFGCGLWSANASSRRDSILSRNSHSGLCWPT